MIDNLNWGVYTFELEKYRNTIYKLILGLVHAKMGYCVCTNLYDHTLLFSGIFQQS